MTRTDFRKAVKTTKTFPCGKGHKGGSETVILSTRKAAKATYRAKTKAALAKAIAEA